MKILHQVGHYKNWNIETHFENAIGDGFIFCAYNTEFGFFDRDKINAHKTEDILAKSFIDLQYFAEKDAVNKEKGQLNTYPFHPASNPIGENVTNVWLLNLIVKGITYQTDVLKLKNVIIPNYYENEDLDQLIALIKEINHWLKKNKKDGVIYYMTIPITNHTVIDKDKIEKLLYSLTDIDIQFDGYYIVCESKPDTGHKISIDFKYLRNLNEVFKVLKKQNFRIIYAYANWDAILFLATNNIDFITIGTFENLRNFSIKRFREDDSVMRPKGWYFSEKLLNFVKSPLLEIVRYQNGIDVIRNEKNIFSDAVLDDNYPWAFNKPEVHKNYLLSISRLLKEISQISDLSKRRQYVLNLLKQAQKNYTELSSHNIALTEESRNYHLGIWEAFIESLK